MPTHQPAPADNDVDVPSRAVRAVFRLSRHLSHILAEVDLTPAQYRVLAFLSEGDTMATEMAGRMAVSKPSVTALIDGLADRALVERQPHPTDRRRRTLCITAAGHVALAAADQATAAHLCSIAELIDDDDGTGTAVEQLARWDHAVRLHRDDRLAAREVR